MTGRRLVLLTAVPMALIVVIVVSVMIPDKREIPVDTVDLRLPPGNDSAARDSAGQLLTDSAMRAKARALGPTSPMRRRVILRDSATVVIGSGTRAAAVFVNGRVGEFISAPQDVRVPAGIVQLSIRAPDCEPWDTTITIPKDARLTIGTRNARCP